ncbi:hypothetical protein S40285_02440 [Stachybotrys chlorohalonatus IBT 40285]|uniref:Protein CMS1 n=1 Tax=Stachybotrys chlorohalonatus (strain IBT 40285) TaxID=1283841 RepID=A0A084R0V2_STAC4|nr:hypothetical protein S40285_02440 [Stachybotrys chlorohalonata IBT 40285]
MSNPKKRAAEDAAPEKKKKNKKRKGNFQEDDALDSELGLNTSVGRMDSQLLADHVAQKLSRFGSDLSTVELADITLSATAIQDTTSWQEPRTLEKLPDFLEKFADDAKDLTKTPAKKGSPHTLIVAGAGLRAADIVRAVRKFSTKDSLIAKLFAKHMKVEEQVTLLNNKKIGIGVGTPARLMELIENGSLSLGNLRRLVVDASHIDQKKRGVMDMKDTMMPLARFLARKEFMERYADEKKPLALLFY